MTAADTTSRNPDDEIWATFGLDENLVGSFTHWTVLLRPKQVTPGSMVLILNRFAPSMAELTADEGRELGAVCAVIESALRERLGMEKINYLALMMVDPHLHFHVIPRYPDAVEVAGNSFADAGWPGPPDLTSSVDHPSLLPTLRDLLQLDPNPGAA